MTNQSVDMIGTPPVRPVPGSGNESNNKAADAHHWSSTAVKSPLYAELFHKGKRIGGGRIRGCGPHGIWMQTRVKVYRGEHLLVQFTLRENGRNTQYGLFGHVVSRRFNEVGILLDVLVPAAQDNLQTLLSLSRQPS